MGNLGSQPALGKPGDALVQPLGSANGVFDLDTQIVDPLQAIHELLHRRIQAALSNKARAALYHAAESLPGLGRRVARITRGVTATREELLRAGMAGVFDTTIEFNEFLCNLGDEFGLGKKDYASYQTIWHAVRNTEPGVISCIVDGELKFIKVNELAERML